MGRKVIPVKKIVVPAHGPGTELKEMLKGIPEMNGCWCKTRAAQMNVWGVEGCRKNLKQIVDGLNQAWSKLPWYQKVKAAGLAVLAGHLTTESLVLEAIRRAEEKSPGLKEARDG